MNRLTQVRCKDVMVVDTQTGDIYEVILTGTPSDSTCYKCVGINCNTVLELDEQNYRDHFIWNLFKYVNYG